MADIKTTYTSDVSRVEANNRKLEKSNMRLIEQNRRLKNSSRGANRATRGALTSLGTYATGLLSTFFSVNQAITQLKAHLADVDQYQTKLADRTMSVAGAQQKLIMMLPTTPGMAETAIGDMEDVAERVHPTGGKKELMITMAGAVSAAPDYETAREATELGAQMGRHDTEDARAVTTAALDMIAVTGEKSSRKNIGFLLAGVKKARAQELKQMAKAVPAMATILSTGGTPREAMAAVTTSSQVMKDPQMKKSSQAAMWMAESLALYAPEEDVMETIKDAKTGRTRQQLRAKGTGMRSFAERIEYVRADEQRLRDFETEYVSKAPMGARGYARAVLGISDKEELNQLARETWLGTLRDMPTVAAAGKFTDEKLAQLRTPFEGRLAEASTVKVATLERLDSTASNMRQAVEGIYKWRGTEEKPGLSELLAGIGESYFGRADEYIEWRGRGSGRAAFEEIIGRKIAGLRQARPLGYEPGYFGQPTGWGVPSEDVEKAQHLEDMLKRMADALERTVEQNNRSHELMEQGGAATAHVAAQAQLGVGGE